MRIIVIGAVAAGTSAAAKARRNDDSADIVIYEKDQDISYSGCGLPYYIGSRISDIKELTPRDASFFKKKYNIDVKTRHEVKKIDIEKKTVLVIELETGKTHIDHYDKLVISTGARSFLPNVDGIDLQHVFCLRNVRDAISIKNFMDSKKPKKAVITGTGFIGLELLENFMACNIEVTIVEMMDKITPNLDRDMACYLENILAKQKIQILKNLRIEKINEKDLVLSDGQVLQADMVLMATGVRPNVELAASAGILIGETGAIAVKNDMSTNADDVYACGDCIETFSSITGKPVYRPLGSTANKTGRIAGDALSGGGLRYRGNLGTGIFQLFDLTIATTGLSEEDAKKEGFDVVCCHNIKPNRPIYFSGEEMVIKGIAEKNSGQLLGVQIIGTEGVDKRIDVFAALVTYKAKVEELFHLDLAYAPPFSTTKDPVHYTGMILDNAIHQGRELLTSKELHEMNQAVQVVDARSVSDYEKKGHVEHAISMPHAKLREMMKDLDPEKVTVTYCNKGVTGNAAQNILLGHGFRKVYNLSGGHKFYKQTKNLK